MKNVLLFCLLFTAINSRFSISFAQGSLTPPGPPGPTMRTLDQLDQDVTQAGEKRIDVLGLTGDGSNQHVITASGSYYLSANLAGVSGLHGISIQSNNVTLDLNGFVLSGATGTSSNGIDIPAAQTGVTIRNGTVTGWHRAVSAETAIGGRLEKLVVNSNSSTGTFVHQGWLVKDCLFLGNGASGLVVHDNCAVLDSLAKDNTNSGIASVGNGELVAHCSAYANKQSGILAQGLGVSIVDCTVQFNGSSGILSFGNATISRCAADQNTNAGIEVSGTGVINDCLATRNTGNGIYAPYGEVVFSRDTSESNQGYGFNGTNATPGASPGVNNVFRDCVASDNSLGGIISGLATIVDGCSVYKNTGNNGGAFGISVSDSSRVVNNTVRENDNDAIRITAGCYALNNTCDYNGRATTNSAGILATGGQNRMESNNISSNLNTGFGIRVTSGGNFIAKNTARGNSDNYSFVAGNRYGAIVDVTASNPSLVDTKTAPNAASTLSTDPWANFSY